MSFYLDHMKHAAQIIKAEPQTKASATGHGGGGAGA